MRYLYFILFFIFISSFSHAFSNVYMGDYCATPPFLTQAIYPNVLILLDNSGSMNEFAYKEESDCRSWNGDTSLVYTGYNSSNNYYGYFDSDAYYDYDSSNEYFIKSTTGNWSGNFLNWLTMRRIDVAKKVLTGGKYQASSSYILIGQIPDRDYRKVYDDSVYPYMTPYHQPLYFYFYNNKGYLYFIVRPYNGRDSTHCLDIQESTTLGEYRVAVYTATEPKGLIQSSWDKVRLGLEVFNVGTDYENNYYRDGGYILSDISGPGPNTSLISAVNNIEPDTWTPLAESLYEAIRYFKGDHSAYNSGTYTSPQQYRCQKNFVIIITDGESTKDENVPGTCFPGYGSPVSDNDFDVKDYMDSIASVEGYSSQKCTSVNSIEGTYYLEGVAYYSHTNDLLSSFSGVQNLDIYTVFCFDESSSARDILQKTAKYGSFVDKNGNNIPDMQSEWDEDSDGVPDAYFEAQNGYLLEVSLKNVLTDILKKTASGTSASLLTKKTRVGKNLIQAVFYPKKQYGTRELNWVGYLYNYWFYSDPNIANIREDTIENKALDICSNGSPGGDNILRFEVNNSTGELNIKAYESTCHGEIFSLTTTYNSLDEIHPVWEAGKVLEQEDSDPYSPEGRIIYTYVNGTEPSSPVDLIELKDLGPTYSYLFGDEDRDGIIDNENNSNGTIIYSPINFDDLKDYIYGKDISGFRNRTTNGTLTWKLGDIIYSTPKIVEYNDYSVVFVGANDGMLHAFKLGKLRYDGLGAYQGVKLCNDKLGSCNTNELGKELWAFIPKNSLPYLRALVDTKYCHLYYVDLMPYIIELNTDNDINNTIDKRILIGGMRLGGGVGCSDSGCINPPLDTCPSPSNYNASSNSCVGLSSYFALDITNSTHPKFLWEFTDPDLGFTYSGPAFIKKDGNYYIMFASGPTNYIGESAQDLKFFVLKLNSNSTSNNFFTISSIYTIDSTSQSTLSSFNNAFGGRLFTEGIDYDDDGNTDMVFIGVTKKTGSTFNGNILAIKISDTNPSHWEIVKVFNSATKPITAKIEYSKCFDMNYIFFGTGRYFYPGDDPGQNTNDRERLYGVRIDNCLTGTHCNINSAHTSSDVCIHLNDNNEMSSWYVELDPKNIQYFKERMISDPTVTDLDVIFFSTTQPTTDVCGFGGRSRMWQLNCATGEGLDNQSCNGYEVGETIGGKLFLQLSQGNIEQITPGIGEGSSFGGGTQGLPTTSWRTGITPESPTPYVGPSSSSQGKILLWIEK